MNNFDFESLTLEEVETIENLVGASIDEAFAEGKPKGKALKIFVWMIEKRKDPKYTIEQASKLSLKDALSMIQGDPEKKG
ncbi:hypothetical protein UFOVP545_17 [uncultured Caudovirales phage]|uniref:Uncharacterized protein n=1 Tax=uncultured Caudovirales phage TaxID=2100421 RepID=A0A6J5MXJ6_9CAUD|nr:hypothetical protein UFOVP545_17 [uncultured Caudovirales phage]